VLSNACAHDFEIGAQLLVLMVWFVSEVSSIILEAFDDDHEKCKSPKVDA